MKKGVDTKKPGMTKKRMSVHPEEALTIEYLMTALKEGSSQGGNTKGLVEQIKEKKINEHKGRTIQMKDPKRNITPRTFLKNPQK